MKFNLSKKIIFIFTFSLFFVLSDLDAATIAKPANNLGLVGYLSFNEGTSTQATDFSGNRNNGTLINMDHPSTISSGWNSGKLGTGLTFDGLGDYVTMDGVANDVTATSFTFSVWIKSGWTGAFDTVLAINTSAIGNQTQIFIDNTLTVRVYDGTQDATELSSSGSVVDGRWHHVVYSRSGATGTLYVDGVSQGTHNSSDTFSGTDLWSLGQEFDAGPTASDFFLGSMDEVRIYNRPLSGTEVLSLYNSGLIKIGSSDAQKNIVTSGLIGYWTLDGGEMTTNTAYDRSSSANTLSLLNDPKKTTGKIGQSINMDAVDDQLFCTEANCGGTTGGKMDMGTRDWTVMAWVRPENGGTNCNIRGTVVGKIGDDEIGWYLGIGGQFICAEIRGVSNISSTLDGSTVPLNEWSHIAVVFDRDGNMTRYLNGVQTGTQDDISANNGSSVDHPHNFCIGARDGAGGCLERLFDGSIDEVRVYERVLTVSEIKQVYNAGVGTKVNNSQNVIGGSTLQTGLVGMWSFNGLDLTDRAYDRSGNSNDGYLVNMATSTAKVAGKVGQALTFDGTDDYVELGNPASLMPASQITMAGWVKPDDFALARHLLAKDNGVAANNSFLRVSLSAQVRCVIDGTGSGDVGPVLTAGTWHHIACVYDGSNLIVYVDGAAVGSAAKTGSITYNSVNWNIGRRAEPGLHMKGKIDEVRMYNRGLSASEVKQLYLGGN